LQGALDAGSWESPRYASATAENQFHSGAPTVLLVVAGSARRSTATLMELDRSFPQKGNGL
jgi:hypothetical protein